MDKKCYKIYIYTNRINGKKYVGQTYKTLELRSGKNGIGYKKCKRFWNAIQKYGWDNFDSEILYDNLTKEEANVLEIQTISSFNTTDDTYGYNISFGGNSCSSPETKIPVVQFDLQFNYINRFDSLGEAEFETGINKSHITKACRHEYRQVGGFIWLFEDDYISNNYDKEHMLYLINKEFVHPNSKQVIQCDLDMNYIARYNNICEASRKTGVRRNGINDNCTHRLKTSGGYIWMYEYEYENNKDYAQEISLHAKTTSHQKTSVIQFDKNMNYIAKFDSILEAANSTGASRKSIVYVCNGKYKQANGYIWRYESDYKDIA